MAVLDRRRPDIGGESPQPEPGPRGIPPPITAPPIATPPLEEPIPFPPAPRPPTPLSIPGSTATPGSASIASLRSPAYARQRLPTPSPAPLSFGPGTPFVGGAGPAAGGGGIAPPPMGGGGVSDSDSLGGFSDDTSGFTGENDDDLIQYIVQALMSRGTAGPK